MGAIGGAVAEALFQVGGWLGWIRHVAWGVPFLLWACIGASNAVDTPWDGARGGVGLALVSVAMAAFFGAAFWVVVTLARGDAPAWAVGFFLVSLVINLATAAVGRRRRRAKAARWER